MNDGWRFQRGGYLVWQAGGLLSKTEFYLLPKISRAWVDTLSLEYWNAMNKSCFYYVVCRKAEAFDEELIAIKALEYLFDATRLKALNWPPRPPVFYV